MNEALKTLENLLELVYNELNRATNDPDLNDKAFRALKEAKIDAIDLKRKIEVARGWNHKIGE